MHILPDLEALEKQFSIQDGLVVVSTNNYTIDKFQFEPF